MIRRKVVQGEDRRRKTGGGVGTTWVTLRNLVRTLVTTPPCAPRHLLGASEVSANLYCNSRTSVLGRLGDYLRLLMKRSVCIPTSTRPIFIEIYSNIIVHSSNQSCTYVCLLSVQYIMSTFHIGGSTEIGHILYGKSFICFQIFRNNIIVQTTYNLW